MIRVILPKKNRLINKLFNTEEAHNANDINFVLRENLDKVIFSSFGDVVQYDVEIHPKVNIKGEEVIQNGQYIEVDNGEEKRIIVFSYELANSTRNGYIISKIPIALRKWYECGIDVCKLQLFLLSVDSDVYDRCKNSNEVYRNVNIVNFTTHTINNTQTFVYKLCQTLGIDILNLHELPWAYNQSNYGKLGKFNSVSDVRRLKNEVRGRNTFNEGSYIVEDDDKVVIYGKTFGNNGFETVLIAWVVKMLADKRVFFWQIKDVRTMSGEERNPSPIASDNLNLLKDLGIVVFDELRDYVSWLSEESVDVGEKEVRDQLEFIKNLLIKFGSDEKKCYLCDCNIQKLIVASHIHRIADIKLENCSFEEKRAKAISGDNGLWLCANHDKLFENGLIYFDDCGVLKMSEKLSEEQLQFIKNISTKMQGESFVIEQEHFNEDMKGYISLHRRRTHPEVEK